jgi:hypothetical protein
MGINECELADCQQQRQLCHLTGLNERLSRDRVSHNEKDLGDEFGYVMILPAE